MTKFLPVVEKFHSLQGEGFHVGKSAFFIRLAGCDVGCSWCDTKNSWNSKNYPLISITELTIEAIETIKKGASFLVITGGEPLHHNLDEFCKAIKNEKETSLKIHLETSGTNEVSGSFDWITLSPKRHDPPKDYFLKHFDELKVIINDENDIQFAKEISIKSKHIAEKTNSKPSKQLFVQPAWNNEKGFSLAIDFVIKNPNWRLSIQTHKYLNLQ